MRGYPQFDNRCPGVKKVHLAEVDGLTLLTSLKQNRHNKRDDSSEANPPRDSPGLATNSAARRACAPKMLAMPLGNPLKIATTMKPTIIAMMLPKSLPRRFGKNSAEKDPRAANHKCNRRFPAQSG